MKDIHFILQSANGILIRDRLEDMSDDYAVTTADIRDFENHWKEQHRVPYTVINYYETKSE